MIEQMLVTLLSASTDLTAYTGGTAKIYPNMAPEHVEPPYVVYMQGSGLERREMSATKAESGFIVMSFPATGIDAANYLLGKQMAKAVREALRVTNYTDFDLCVTEVRLTDQSDDYSEEHTQHGVIQKFIFYEVL